MGEYKGRNIAANSLWPVTMVESHAVINHKLGTPKYWRKGEILADAAVNIVSHTPNDLTGQAILDEPFLRSVGVTDFNQYRCDPNFEPPKMDEIKHMMMGAGKAKEAFQHVPKL